MSLIRHSLLVAAIVAALGLAACNKEPTTPTALKLDGAASQRAAAAIAGPAWLRERLPEHTVAYVRIPSPWGLASAPNGRALDVALASEAHTKLIADLRAGIAKDPLLVQAGAAPALALLLDDLTGPVEIAVVDGSDIANPASNVLLSAPLKFADVAALNARLAELKAPLLPQPLAADGKGKLTGNGFVRFDAATQRLYCLFGMAASAPALDLMIQQTAQTRAHPMHATEKDIDSSGQGLFYWMSLKGVTGMASAQIAAAKPGTALRDFLDKGQSIAGGWGTSGARGKLQVQLVAPQARLLSYFAPTDFKAAVKTAGRPDWALTMALPTAVQIATIEANLDADFGPGTRETYVKGKEKMQAELGVDLVELLGMLGGSMVAFEDEAGLYSAIHMPDRTAFYAKLDVLLAKLKGTRETVTSGKATVNHLYLPGFNLTKPKQDGEEKTAADAWLQLYARVGSHVYWVEEGDYLVFAEVPQALADRADAKLDGQLDTWLRQNQSYDPNATVLGITGKTRHAQRKVYYAYLGALQATADALGQKASISALPHAAGLKLPVEGATGLTLDATKDRVGISLTYEQNPAEVLFGSGGLAAVATAGILAAVALPAYQDYVARSQATQVLGDAAQIKTAVAEHYLTSGDVPAGDDDLDLAEFGPSLKFLSGHYVDNGAVVLQFGDEVATSLADTTLVLKPYELDGNVVWQCGDGAVDPKAQLLSNTAETTSAPAKLLPSDCRP